MYYQVEVNQTIHTFTEECEKDREIATLKKFGIPYTLTEHEGAFIAPEQYGDTAFYLPEKASPIQVRRVAAWVRQQGDKPLFKGAITTIK